VRTNCRFSRKRGNDYLQNLGFNWSSKQQRYSNIVHSFFGNKHPFRIFSFQLFFHFCVSYTNFLWITDTSSWIRRVVSQCWTHGSIRHRHIWFHWIMLFFKLLPVSCPLSVSIVPHTQLLLYSNRSDYIFVENIEKQVFSVELKLYTMLVIQET
jgi:hypothetical protein